jgi:hypothetical protein
MERQTAKEAKTQPRRPTSADLSLPGYLGYFKVRRRLINCTATPDAGSKSASDPFRTDDQRSAAWRATVEARKR